MTSFRDRALADLEVADYEAMLKESETLFVEHKSALREEQFNLVKAAASFANGLGGWILIGVRDGAVVSGKPGEWAPPQRNEVFVDQVRDALDRKIDPPVPFAASFRTLDDGVIGVVRVYESVDTPHIVKQNGGIYVRETAKDRRTNRAGSDAYEPAAVRSQALLLELSRRGQKARAHADKLLGPGGPPWVTSSLNLRLERVSETLVQMSRPGAGATLRLVPLTRLPRMSDWAVSRDGMDQLAAAARRLAHRTDLGGVDEKVNVRGLAVRTSSPDGVTVLERMAPRHWVAMAVADAAGVVGLSLNYGNPTPRPERERLLPLALRLLLIDPLLREGARLLQEAEFYGRAQVHLFLSDLQELLQLDVDGVLEDGPGCLPLGGEIVIPAQSDLNAAEPDGDLLDLASQWSDDAARSVGFPVLR